MQQAGAEVIRLSDSSTTYRTQAAGNVSTEMPLDYFVVCKELEDKMQHVEVVDTSYTDKMRGEGTVSRK